MKNMVKERQRKQAKSSETIQCMLQTWSLTYYSIGVKVIAVFALLKFAI